MSDAVTTQHGTRLGEVQITVDAQPSMKIEQGVVPFLLYPWEMLSAGNWDFPETESSPENDDAKPRFDLMPLDSLFVWTLMGDQVRDESAGGWTTPPFPNQYLAPDGRSSDGLSDRIAPLTQADRTTGWTSAPRAWLRMLLLTDPSGEVADEALYLLLKVYAGPECTTISSVNSLLGTLRYQYLDA